MAVLPAKQVGPDRVLARTKFGKGLIEKDFKNPRTGKIEDFGIFDYKGGTVRPSIFMPITTDGNVVAIRQFREAANEVILEFPGGNPKAGQTAEDVVRAELKEETGYAVGTIINLAPAKDIWIEPSSFSTPMRPFLVTGCVKVGEQELDETENIEVELFTLKEWLKMCFDGRVCCGKTLAITLLALPHLWHLGFKLELEFRSRSVIPA